MRITQIFVWWGGVIAPNLADHVLGAAPGGPSAAEQVALLRLERALALGQLAPEGFCKRAAAIVGIPDRDVKHSCTDGLPTDLAVLGIIAELAERCQTWLIVDQPLTWALAALNRAGVEGLIPPERLYTVADHALPGLIQGPFTHLRAVGMAQPGQALFIDAHPLRMMSAIRAGFDAAAFVDAPRLRRDLALWGLLGGA